MPRQHPSHDPESIVVARGRTLTRILPNGFTILVEPDHSAPVASVQVWIETGSIHENQWLGGGVSHFLEHMMFKGTATRGPNDIARTVEEAGGYINAYTSFDRTVYWIDIPSDATSTAIEILADATLESNLPKGEFAKEQEVIRREFAMGFDNPNRAGSDLMLATMFSQSPYRHPIIGHLDIFNRLTRDDLDAYYRSRYVPDNMFLVVSGDVNPDEIFAFATECFGKVPRGTDPPLFIPIEPLQLGRREAHEEFDTELSRCSLTWHIPSVTHPDNTVLDVLSGVMGGGRSSPLHLELRERRELVHYISSYAYSAGDMGVFGIEFLCDPDKRSDAERAALDIIQRFASQPALDSEINKTRKNILASQLDNLSTARGRASEIGGSWLLTRNPDFITDAIEQISRVGADDLLRVTRHYLTDRNVTVTSINPRGSIHGTKISRTTASERKIENFTLSNGLRILVCADHKLPVISAVASFRGGLLAESSATNGITSLLTRTITKGTTTRSSDHINDEIESVGGTLDASCGNNTISISTEVMTPDLRLGLDLLADVLINATFPKEEIAREKEAQLASIKAQNEEIVAIARKNLRSAIYGDHPYAFTKNGTPKSVKSITQDQLLAFRNLCITAQNGVLAIFGDIDPVEIRHLTEEIFSSLPSGELLITELPTPNPLEKNVEIVVNEPKQQAVIMSGFLVCNAFDPDRAALEILDAASSDMSSRFFQKIREELGLAYYVGSSQMSGFAPGLFTFYLGTDPEKVPLVQKNFNAEITLLACDGLSEAELQRAKKKIKGSQAIRRQSIDAIAQDAAQNELYGLGYDFHIRHAAEIEAVTLEDVRRIARKYFQNAHNAFVLVTPKSK